MRVSLLLAIAAVSCSNMAAPSQIPNNPQTLPVPVVMENQPVTSRGWSEVFVDSILSNRWQISNYQYTAGDDTTTYLSSNISFRNEALALRSYQHRTFSGDRMLSEGAEIRSVEKYGFGTYIWVMRASSTSPTPDGQGDRTSGETSACFIFSLNETELDVEQQGGKPDLIYFVTWKNGKNVSNFQSVARAWETFHEYRIEWLPGSVTYSIDGYIVGKETRDIPQQPGFIVINHWGSNRMAWGGLADEREKWMYVRSFSFMPLEN